MLQPKQQHLCDTSSLFLYLNPFHIRKPSLPRVETWQYGGSSQPSFPFPSQSLFSVPPPSHTPLSTALSPTPDTWLHGRTLPSILFNLHVPSQLSPLIQSATIAAHHQLSSQLPAVVCAHPPQALTALKYPNHHISRFVSVMSSPSTDVNALLPSNSYYLHPRTIVDTSIPPPSVLHSSPPHLQLHPIRRVPLHPSIQQEHRVILPHLAQYPSMSLSPSKPTQSAHQSRSVQDPLPCSSYVNMNRDNSVTKSTFQCLRQSQIHGQLDSCNRTNSNNWLDYTNCHYQVYREDNGRIVVHPRINAQCDKNNDYIPNGYCQDSVRNCVSSSDTSFSQMTSLPENYLLLQHQREFSSCDKTNSDATLIDDDNEECELWSVNGEDLLPISLLDSTEYSDYESGDSDQATFRSSIYPYSDESNPSSESTDVDLLRRDANSRRQ